MAKNNKILSGFNSLQELITRCKSVFPDILCKTLGSELDILVPLPAANIATLNIFYLNDLIKFNS